MSQQNTGKMEPGEVRTIPTPGPDQGGRVEFFPENHPSGASENADGPGVTPDPGPDAGAGAHRHGPSSTHADPDSSRPGTPDYDPDHNQEG